MHNNPFSYLRKRVGDSHVCFQVANVSSPSLKSPLYRDLSFHRTPMTFPFVFQRSKLVAITKPEFTERDVVIDTKIYPDMKNPLTVDMMQNALQSGLPVSTSRRTLAQILSLSHPENLSSYSINSIRTVWGKKRVNYSRHDSEPNIAVRILFVLFFFYLLITILHFRIY